MESNNKSRHIVNINVALLQINNLFVKCKTFTAQFLEIDDGQKALFIHIFQNMQNNRKTK